MSACTPGCSGCSSVLCITVKLNSVVITGPIIFMTHCVILPFRLICVICLHPILQQHSPACASFIDRFLSACIVYAHKLVLTPMLSVMVCPSLKPKSSFGPESPSWAFLLSSVSCFTHLQRSKTHKHTLSALIQK